MYRYVRMYRTSVRLSRISTIPPLRPPDTPNLSRGPSSDLLNRAWQHPDKDSRKCKKWAQISNSPWTGSPSVRRNVIQRPTNRHAVSDRPNARERPRSLSPQSERRANPASMVDPPSLLWLRFNRQTLVHRDHHQRCPRMVNWQTTTLVPFLIAKGAGRWNVFLASTIPIWHELC